MRMPAQHPHVYCWGPLYLFLAPRWFTRTGMKIPAHDPWAESALNIAPCDCYKRPLQAAMRVAGGVRWQLRVCAMSPRSAKLELLTTNVKQAFGNHGRGTYSGEDTMFGRASFFSVAPSSTHVAWSTPPAACMARPRPQTMTHPLESPEATIGRPSPLLLRLHHLCRSSQFRPVQWAVGARPTPSTMVGILEWMLGFEALACTSRSEPWRRRNGSAAKWQPSCF
jgi:hypothetical protein